MIKYKLIYTIKYLGSVRFFNVFEKKSSMLIAHQFRNHSKNADLVLVTFLIIINILIAVVQLVLLNTFV